MGTAHVARGGTGVLLTGPIYVTEKSWATYTAGQTGDWYVRDPSSVADWGNALRTNSSTFNKLWKVTSARVAAVRTEAVVGGELRRRRLDVEICPGCGPGHRPSGPGLEWGIFGASPWISSGPITNPSVERLYDLEGQHDLNGPFGDPSWLESPGGVETAGNWQVEWTERTSLDPDIVGYDFEVTSAAKGGYHFGIAVDPDLSGVPEDDVSGYDANRGMVYVQDAGMAVGFLLRDSAGDALVTANQYGGQILAPVSDGEARSAMIGPGIALTSGPDDVQLVLSAEAEIGTHTWTLWVLRGDDLAEIRDLADTVLKM